MSDSKTHEILILGGNFGGVGAAHYLLRHTIPALQNADDSKTYHVTLVTPNTHFLFKPATPRVLIAPNLLPEEKIWKPLASGFERYPADQITLVHGVATALDPSKKTVTVKLNSAAKQTLTYNTLVLSTGTTGTTPAFSLHADQSATTQTFQSIQTALPKAKTALVAGGGAVGVETAGELGVAFPSIDLTVLSGSTKLLERCNPSVSARAQSYLEKTIGATVVHNVRVTATTANPDGSTTVILSDGTTRIVDVYLDCTGGRPNSDYLPKTWLDETGRVVKKDGYFRARGDEAEEGAEDVYVLGDLVAGSDNTIMAVDAMTPTVCSAIGADIAAIIGKEGQVPPAKPFNQMIKNTMMVPIGPYGGVGQLFGWAMPSFFVRFAKARTFLVEMFDGYVTGDKWKNP